MNTLKLYSKFSFVLVLCLSFMMLVFTGCGGGGGGMMVAGQPRQQFRLTLHRKTLVPTAA